MLESTQVPEEIAPDEELGRAIFSSKQARNSLPKHLFFPDQGETRLSVDRLSHATNDEAIAISQQRAKRRKRKFYGWAVLTAAAACQSKRTVVSSPEDDNPYHAHILLPQKATDDAIAIHAQELADSASLKKLNNPLDPE